MTPPCVFALQHIHTYTHIATTHPRIHGSSHLVPALQPTDSFVGPRTHTIRIPSCRSTTRPKSNSWPIPVFPWGLQKENPVPSVFPVSFASLQSLAATQAPKEKNSSHGTPSPSPASAAYCYRSRQTFGLHLFAVLAFQEPTLRNANESNDRITATVRRLMVCFIVSCATPQKANRRPINVPSSQHSWGIAKERA